MHDYSIETKFEGHIQSEKSDFNKISPLGWLKVLFRLPVSITVKVLKNLGSIILALGLLMLGLLFIIAPGWAANLGLFFIKAAE
ncbi:MAG TPA: hypothetical protein VHQ70_11365 [Syntrophomonadaceae bacterium]|nr:hypothetical protein [Syntrophomonadaceae bacterium]